MSALAQILHQNGARVMGSDLADNDEVKKLRALGIKVYSSHRAEQIKKAQVVVYSSAIHEDNPELIAAKEQGKTIVRRAELLGEVASLYHSTIAISGSHGKTTATAMISEIFLKAKLDPTIHIGGKLNCIGSNYVLGKSDIFITEACEYMDNFLFIMPDIALVLNVDCDHLDYFGNIDRVKDSFKKFGSNIRRGGLVMACYDDAACSEIFPDGQAATFGLNEKADMVAKNVHEYAPGYFAFTPSLMGFELGEIKLNILGKHNIYNALAAIFVAMIFDIDFDVIQSALENFSGTERRCEVIANNGGALILHDYAHHPKQIESMICSAKQMKGESGRIITVFEPHTYSRTKFLLNEFAKSFEGSDILILAPVYSARESESEGANSLELMSVAEKFVSDIRYGETYEKIYQMLSGEIREGDIVLILGAGTIDSLAKKFKT